MAASSPSIANEPSTRRAERSFRSIVLIAAISMIVLLIGVIVILFLDSRTAIERYGFSFLITSDWDPVFEKFGAAPYIFGTIVTSVLALILATPFAIGAALFISEYAPKTIAGILSFIIELLVAIPSVGFGLWGLYVLAPFMRGTVDPFLRNVIGPIPIIGALFKGPTIGQDLLTASVILAIMILPTILSISREIIAQVPRLHAKWAEARVLAPEQEELAFWQGVTIADKAADIDTAVSILKPMLAMDARRDEWIELIRRLGNCGLIEREGADAELIAALR